VFYLSYIVSELRRRSGRTLLTALGLGVGVGLVVAVSALSAGLDRAQDQILEPLTGVGTDMSVTRPIEVDADEGGGGPFGGLSEAEREQLQEENGGARLDLQDVGEPGERFSETSFMTTQLSFPASTVDDIRGLDGVQDATGSLTLSATTISGTVPEGGFGGGQGGPGLGGPPAGGGGGPRNIDFTTVTVTGVDVAKPQLATVGPSEITDGAYLSEGDRREVVVGDSYAKANGVAVGDRVELMDARYRVVGIARAPLGGSSSDLYLKLDQLQTAADREDRVNTVLVRATNADQVAAVEAGIGRTLEGASVTTAADLADRVGGSLSDTKALSDQLGLALTIVALVAAFLIASLLTLSSVTKRIRELGTLKALGWPRRTVVRQVTGESLAQGALGGIIGGLLGVSAAAAINAIGLTLEASVAAPEPAGRGMGPAGGGFGQGAIQSGSTQVALEAPIDPSLIVLAIALALLGGLIAGSVGGLRAARLRPAAALRHLG
jgi:ABC-type lipoprotein release transport system permease subunit